MFTGIITGLGRIVDVQSLGADSDHGKRLTLQAPPGYLDDVQSGDSIALNGACMTVTTFDAPSGRFEIDLSAESLAKTAGLDRPGPVNLEKALRANDRLGGHLVSGHVDGLGHVTHFAPVGESFELRIAAPLELSRFLAYKGSITVNGVSLTVNRVTDAAEGATRRSPSAANGPHDGASSASGGPAPRPADATEFSINLIPHTLEQTTLGALKAGDAVNLEVDLIARYVARMLGKPDLG